MRDTYGVVAASHVVVRLLALSGVSGRDFEVVVAVEEHESLDQEILAVLGLPLECIVDVALADAEKHHLVCGIDTVRSKEVI